jgi:hypothetical protein
VPSGDHAHVELSRMVAEILKVFMSSEPINFQQL